MTMKDGGFWVFGYGSLIWRPGFDYAERRRARLSGFRRAFCLRSIRYRGTPEAPGLVLGLDADPAAHCEGVVFRVPAHQADETRAYLHEREMGTDSYFETFQTVDIADHGPDDALCYVMDPDHFQYTRISLEEQAAIIAASHGPAGPNCDYLHATVEHLIELGIADPDLMALDKMVRALHHARDASRDAAGGKS
jgi:cation transport protein ChaC